MSDYVNWPSIGVDEHGFFIQSGEDQISYRCESCPNLNGGGSLQQVGLQIVSPVTGLKRIRVLDNAGTELSTITCQIGRAHV